jgi:hypothetical protein
MADFEKYDMLRKINVQEIAESARAEIEISCMSS